MFPWRRFLHLATGHLDCPVETVGDPGNSQGGQPSHRSWCAWTTFGRLQDDCGYWTAELPRISELGEWSVADGGAWGQPFPYDDLAHIIIPRRFIEEHTHRGFCLWQHRQDIDGLIGKLEPEGIAHYVSSHALEVKLF